MPMYTRIETSSATAWRQGITISPSFPRKLREQALITTLTGVPLRTFAHVLKKMPLARSSTHLGRSLKGQCARRGFSTTPCRRAGEVRIVEVGPRDGLQNEKSPLNLQTKLELIRRLSQTGVRNIEAGSFVAPKWVPQVRQATDYLIFFDDFGGMNANMILPSTDGKLSRGAERASRPPTIRICSHRI